MVRPRGQGLSGLFLRSEEAERFPVEGGKVNVGKVLVNTFIERLMYTKHYASLGEQMED